MAPRFSILLPTHNRDDVIGYAIRSCLWQTESDFELLIVGDGCTDQTAEIVSQFKDERIRWFDLPKAPLSGYANRNVALREARGDFIAYAQHDDVFFPDHLTLLAEVAETTEAYWCYSRPLWVEAGVLAPFAIDLTREAELAFFKITNHIPSSCVMHTRESLERVGYWPEDVPRCADWVCWNRMIDAYGPGRLAYCREPTALHFRANWRKGPEYDSPAVASLLRIAQEYNWWPEALRCPVAPGLPEQASAFDVISSGGVSYRDSVRHAVRELYERVSWLEVRDGSLHDLVMTSASGDEP